MNKRYWNMIIFLIVVAVLFGYTFVLILLGMVLNQGLKCNALENEGYQVRLKSIGEFWREGKACQVVLWNGEEVWVDDLVDDYEKEMAWKKKIKKGINNE